MPFQIGIRGTDDIQKHDLAAMLASLDNVTTDFTNTNSYNYMHARSSKNTRFEYVNPTRNIKFIVKNDARFSIVNNSYIPSNVKLYLLTFDVNSRINQAEQKEKVESFLIEMKRYYSNVTVILVPVYNQKNIPSLTYQKNIVPALQSSPTESSELAITTFNTGGSLIIKKTEMEQISENIDENWMQALADRFNDGITVSVCGSAINLANKQHIGKLNLLLLKKLESICDPIAAKTLTWTFPQVVSFDFVQCYTDYNGNNGIIPIVEMISSAFRHNDEVEFQKKINVINQLFLVVKELNALNQPANFYQTCVSYINKFLNVLYKSSFKIDSSEVKAAFSEFLINSSSLLPTEQIDSQSKFALLVQSINEIINPKSESSISGGKERSGIASSSVSAKEVTPRTLVSPNNPSSKNLSQKELGPDQNKIKENPGIASSSVSAKEVTPRTLVSPNNPSSKNLSQKELKLDQNKINAAGLSLIESIKKFQSNTWAFFRFNFTPKTDPQTLLVQSQQFLVLRMLVILITHRVNDKNLSTINEWFSAIEKFYGRLMNRESSNQIVNEIFTLRTDVYAKLSLPEQKSLQLLDNDYLNRFSSFYNWIDLANANAGETITAKLLSLCDQYNSLLQENKIVSIDSAYWAKIACWIDKIEKGIFTEQDRIDYHAYVEKEFESLESLSSGITVSNYKEIGIPLANRGQSAYMERLINGEKSINSALKKSKLDGLHIAYTLLEQSGRKPNENTLKKFQDGIEKIFNEIHVCLSSYATSISQKDKKYHLIQVILGKNNKEQHAEMIKIFGKETPHYLWNGMGAILSKRFEPQDKAVPSSNPSRLFKVNVAEDERTFSALADLAETLALAIQANRDLRTNESNSADKLDEYLQHFYVKVLQEIWQFNTTYDSVLYKTLQNYEDSAAAKTTEQFAPQVHQV